MTGWFAILTDRAPFGERYKCVRKYAAALQTWTAMSASRSKSNIDLVFEGAESREVGFVFQRVESGRVGHIGNDKVGHEFRQ